MREKLRGYKVSDKIVAVIAAKFKNKDVGSIMIASDATARGLSGDYLGAVYKNRKNVVQSDGINPGYWDEVLGGRLTDGLIAIRKRSELQYDIGCFRPGTNSLSGVIYKNDPAMLSSEDGTIWSFVQSFHADPNGERYQALSSVQQNAACVKRDRVYLCEEQNTADLMYFSRELARNADYCDRMRCEGKIEWEN